MSLAHPYHRPKTTKDSGFTRNFRLTSTIKRKGTIFYNSSRKSSADQTADINKDQLSLKKISNEEIDDDYRPAKSNKRKARKNKQDENRNVIPNSIHQILSFIQKKTKSLSYVQKAFAKFEH